MRIFLSPFFLLRSLLRFGCKRNPSSTSCASSTRFRMLISLWWLTFCSWLLLFSISFTTQAQGEGTDPAPTSTGAQFQTPGYLVTQPSSTPRDDDWFITPQATTFTEDVNGCPIGASSISVDDLDPMYAAMCSRCWATGTPHPRFLIPDMSFETPSGGLCTNRYEDSATFTPMAATPVGSWTPAPTSTPYQVMCGTPVPTSTPTPTGTAAPTLTATLTPTPVAFTNTQIEGSDAAVTSSGTLFQGNFLSPTTGTSVNSTMGVFNQSVTVDLGGWYYVQSVTLRLYRPPNQGGGSPWNAYETWNPHTNIYSNPAVPCGGLISSFTTAGFAGTFTTVATGVMSAPYLITNKIVISRAPGETGGNVLMLDYLLFAGAPAHAPACSFSTPTATPTVTPTIWYDPGVVSPTPAGLYSCGTVVLRSQSPVVDIPSSLDRVGYDCYMIVPELDIYIPTRGTVGLEGIELCVEWVTFPFITFLTVRIYLDYVLVFPIAWLVRRLLTF